MPSNKSESTKPAAVAPPTPATAPGGDAAPPSPPEPSSPVCAECGGPVKMYEGYNPHKAGQAWCLNEDARRPFAEPAG